MSGLDNHYAHIYIKTFQSIEEEPCEKNMHSSINTESKEITRRNHLSLISGKLVYVLSIQLLFVRIQVVFKERQVFGLEEVTAIATMMLNSIGN